MKFQLWMAGSDEWMSVAEAAKYLGKSRHWLYQNHQRLGIPSVVVGGTYRFNKASLDEWLAHSLSKSPAKTQTNLEIGRAHV